MLLKNHSSTIKQILFPLLFPSPLYPQTYSCISLCKILHWPFFSLNIAHWKNIFFPQGKQELGSLTDKREHMQWYIYESWFESHCCEWKYFLWENKRLQKQCKKISREMAKSNKKNKVWWFGTHLHLANLHAETGVLTWQWEVGFFSEDSLPLSQIPLYHKMIPSEQTFRASPSWLIVETT